MADPNTIEIKIHAKADTGELTAAGNAAEKVADRVNKMGESFQQLKNTDPESGLLKERMGKVGEGFGEVLKQIPDMLNVLREQVKEWDDQLDDAIAKNAAPDFIEGINAKKRVIEEYETALFRFKDAAENAFRAEQSFINSQKNDLTLLDTSHDAQTRTSQAAYDVEKARLHAKPPAVQPEASFLDLDIARNNEKLGEQKNYDTTRKLMLQRDIEDASTRQPGLDEAVAALNETAKKFASQAQNDETREAELHKKIDETKKELDHAIEWRHKYKPFEIFDALKSKDSGAHLVQQRKADLENATRKYQAEQDDLKKVEDRLPGEKAAREYFDGAIKRAVQDANDNRAHIQELNGTLQLLLAQIKISWPAAEAATQNANTTAILNSPYAGQLIRASELQGKSVEGLIDLWEQLSRRINDIRSH